MTHILFVMLTISVISALFAFALIRNFFFACAASVAAASFLFQVYEYLQNGYWPEPFFLIPAAVTAVIAICTAMVVGLAIRHYERKPQ